MRNTSILFAFLFLFPYISNAQKVKPGVSIGHSGKVVALQFSPDGRFVVSAGGDGDGFVKLWETKTGRLVKTWNPADNVSGFRKYSSDVAFLDDQYILAASNGKPLQRWDFAMKEGENVNSLIDPDASSHPTVRAFRVHPKKKEVLTLDDKNHLRLWNSKSLKPVKTFDEPTERITSLCFSADGQLVYTGTENGNVITWDVRKGKPTEKNKIQNDRVLSLEVGLSPVRTWILSGTEKKLEVSDIASQNDKTALDQAYSPGKASVSPLRTAVFSPDGKYIAYGATGQNPMLVIWDIENKKARHTLVDVLNKEKNGLIQSVSFSADGQQVVSGYFNGTVLLWDVETGDLLYRLKGKPKEIKQIGFTQDHKFAFFIYDSENNITIWNGKKSEGLILEGHERDVLAASFSPGGDFLLSSAEDKTLIKWDFQKDSILWQSRKLEETVISIAISPDAKYALTSSSGKKVDIWDLDKMAVKKSFADHSKKVTSLAFSEDGRFAMTAAGDNFVNVYDLKDNFKRTNIPKQTNRINPVAFSPDGKYFVSISCTHNLIELWDIEGKRIDKTFKLKDYQKLPQHPFVCSPSGRPVFSPDGKYFIVPSLHGALLWNLNTGQPKYLKGHAQKITSVAFTAGGRIAVAGGNDGSMTLWKVKDGEPLVTIFQLSDENWAAITPDGQFDASPGALREMFFVQDLETIDLEQLKDTYYEPDLLPILLGYEIGKLRNVGSLDELKMYPEISVAIKNNKLHIDLTERTGGIGKVSVFINGSEIMEDACGGDANCSPIDLEQYTSHYFSKEEDLHKNVISLLAYNEEGWLKSPPYEVYPFPKASRGGPGGLKNISFATRPDPGIHAIIIGTSQYNGENIDLGFPDKDAQAMATSIANISGPLFKGAVHITLLTTEGSDETKWPSKTNVQAAFRKVASTANAEDVLFLFLSGHGVTYTDGEKSDFYYLTMDCGDMNLAAADRRNNFCISTDTLTDWIKKIPAKKRVVILDACHSGQAAENLFASRSLSSSQERELERLKDRNGMFVLASSESGQRSWEDKNLQQGLLTYSLLHGMAKTDGAVDVSELFNFARDYVPQLAEGIAEDQTPVLTVPTKEASSFPIGFVTESTVIPISKKSDFIAPSLFLDKNLLDDHLYLSNLLDEHLAEGLVNGRLNKMVFTKSPQKKEVYAIRGLYEVNNGTVTLNGRVFKGGVQKATFQVVAKTTDRPDVWEQKIVEAVNGSLE